MMGLKNSALVFVILCGALSLQVGAQNRPTFSFGEAEFSNGFKTNVDSLVDSIENPSKQGDSYRQNEFEQNDHYLSVFSSNEGHEYIKSTDQLADTAMSNIRQLKTLVDRTGIDTAQSFDHNGYPMDKGVAEVSVIREDNCPYDLANNDRCTDMFREPSGRCNHMMSSKKTWGMAMTPYDRVLSAKYEDGIGAPRITELFSKRPLKSAREISTLVTTTRVVLDESGVNAQIMQWGQFVSHDITQLSVNNSNIRCCPDQLFRDNPANKGRSPTSGQLAQLREEIKVSSGDICLAIEFNKEMVYEGRDYVCMDVRRSRPAPTHNCFIGLRQQMNAATHLIDGSVIYGSSQKDQTALRQLIGGRMKVQVVDGETLPPQNISNCNATQKSTNRCPFAAGDNRINMTPNLVSLHAVFLTKHNQIAAKLGAINSHWDDERIFQETRRILSAIQGNIHYYEYLPLIIGDRLIKRYKLNSYAGFDAHINPSILNELAHGAMRFGHTTINGFFKVINNAGILDQLNLRPRFFNSEFIYKGGIKQCIRGMQDDEPWIVDENVPEQMRDFLFNQMLDIIAINIKRGRDHGLQSYVEYRKHYGLSYPLTWDDLSATHSEEARKGLRKAYTTVNDMELYIAGVTENHVDGGLIGELFANILGEGFSKLLKGDRLWFEGPNSGLTSAQVRAIKGYKYNQLLCEGAELKKISNNAFLRPKSAKAREVSCSSLTPLNLNLWKEDLKPEPVCYWKVVSTSPCCLGKRQITRRCVGGINCGGKCIGKDTVIKSCKCKGFWCYLNILGRGCRFKRTSRRG